MDKTPEVLVTFDMECLAAARGLLEKHAHAVYLRNPTDAELLAAIPRANALVTNLRQRITPEIMDEAKNLIVIATPSTGTDHIDIDHAKRKGIVIQSLKNDNELLKSITSTAEHSLLLILACLRRLPWAYDSVRKGQWARDRFCGREAAGRTLGIVGYGRLGNMLSTYAKTLSMKVIATDPEKTITDPWVKQVALDTLLKTAEIISLHVHLRPETRKMLGAHEFGLMRNGVYLVNTSRGGLIDESAFLAALQSGKIACAGIDVLANELMGDINSDPLVEYARLNDNLIITPHIGGCSSDARAKSSVYMVEKLLRFLTAH